MTQSGEASLGNLSKDLKDLGCTCVKSTVGRRNSRPEALGQRPPSMFEEQQASAAGGRRQGGENRDEKWGTWGMGLTGLVMAECATWKHTPVLPEAGE